MTSVLRTLGHVVRADYLERVRRHAFLVTLAFTLYAAYTFLPPADSRISTLDIAGHRGIYNSAWVGCAVAMLTTVFLSLIGFYLVKNAVENDRRTGVGQILATTPLSKPLYTLGKAGSNFAVLATMALLVAIAAMGMQLLRGEDRHLDVLAVLTPFAIVALPALAVTAALAVLFETIRWLRGGLGNVVYFFLFSGAMASGALSRHDSTGIGDLMGTNAVLPAMIRGVVAAFPGVDPVNTPMNMGINIGDRAKHLTTFVWSGPEWTSEAILGRLVWLLIGIGIAVTAAIPFDRFDATAQVLPRLKARGRRQEGTRERGAPQARGSTGMYGAGRGLSEAAQEARPSVPSIGGPFLPSPTPPQGTPAMVTASALTTATHSKTTLPAMLRAELTLMLRAVPKPWWLIAAGLAAACWFAPMPVARGWFLMFAWIWPLPMWSPMGAREALHQTEGLLFSSPRPLARQLGASWLAGFCVAAVLGAGIGARLAIAGDGAGVVAWLVGACFIPSLAIACGAWTASGRLFEVLYFLLWYIGPANHTPPLDYVATSAGAVAAGSPARFAAIAVALVIVAVLGRGRRLNR